MTTRGRLILTALVMGAISGVLAMWASKVYADTDLSSGLGYAMRGRSVDMANMLGAADAAAASGPISIAAWVFLAAGLAAVIAAVVVKSEAPKPGQASDII